MTNDMPNETETSLGCSIGIYCRTHDVIHGAEAGRLRKGIEALVRGSCPSDQIIGITDVVRAYDLETLLDEIGVHDSAAFLERHKQEVLRQHRFEKERLRRSEKKAGLAFPGMETIAEVLGMPSGAHTFDDVLKKAREVSEKAVANEESQRLLASLLETIPLLVGSRFREVDKVITIEMFANRTDLRGSYPGVLSIRYAKDVGALLRRRSGWYATNDVRWEIVGIKPHTYFVPPTVGPFSSPREAFEAYKEAFEKLRKGSHAGIAKKSR